MSSVVGCIVFAAMEGEPYRARLVGAFVVGLGAAWAVVWLYARLRWGRGVRIRMDMR